MELLIIAVAVVVGLIVLVWAATLAFGGLAITLIGAHLLFEFAAEQGFIGIAVYVACWVFLFPVMLIASLAVGFIDFQWGDRMREAQLEAEMRPSPFVEMIERTHPAVAKLRRERQGRLDRAIRLHDEASD